ncbi:MAG: TraR/DksA family transcriptional regulator [Oleiphilaceae bacterium]|nr:TraR/DksA family transcriptional regulator [Oleiphilaceae bacterium]
MGQSEREHFTNLLIKLRDELLETRAAREESTATVTLDQTSTGRLSRMDALQNQAIAQAGQARAENQLRLIEAALRRLDEDDFGYCLECDEPINPKRLEIDPTCRYCIHCAS